MYIWVDTLHVGYFDPYTHGLKAIFGRKQKGGHTQQRWHQSLLVGVRSDNKTPRRTTIMIMRGITKITSITTTRQQQKDNSNKHMQQQQKRRHHQTQKRPQPTKHQITKERETKRETTKTRLLAASLGRRSLGAEIVSLRGVWLGPYTFSTQ